VGCAKTAEPIDMSFWMKTRMGPRNHVLDGDIDPPTGRGNFGGFSRPHKSIGNLHCSRCYHVCFAAKRIIQSPVTSCSRMDYSVCQASTNRNQENSECRRCDLSDGKGVGVHSEGKV